MPTELYKTTDKNGDELTIYFDDSIANTPVVSIFLKVYAEIIEKGWCNPTIPFGNSNKVVWAQRPDGSIAGGICFEHNPSVKLVWIVLSFTTPEERGKGINGVCHTAFEKVAKNIGATQIASLVHIDNASRLRSSEKVGLKPQYYRMQKSI